MHIRMTAAGLALAALVAVAPGYAQKPEPASKGAGAETKVAVCVQWEKETPEGPHPSGRGVARWRVGLRCISQSFMNFSATDHAFISEIVNPAVPSRNPRLST
jgi:hypothetical protein